MRLSIIVAISLLSLPAHAAPNTYACTLVDGAGQPGMYGDVDQVIIDREAKLIELRVAKTMGTSNPVNWIFTTRTGYDGTPEQIVMSDRAGGGLVAAGWDAGGSYSFKLAGEYLMFGNTYVAPALAFTWKCDD